MDAPSLSAPRRVGPTRRAGLEADGSWRFGDVDVFANYTYVRAQFRSGAFGGVPIAGHDVPLVPRHAANAGASWKFLPGTRASAVARYVGRRHYDADETNGFGRLMPSYTVVDAKVLHEARGWLLQAGVRNLFARRYYSYGVYTGFPTFAALPALFDRLGGSPWAVYRFLVQHHPELGGRTAREALRRGRSAEVLEVAESVMRAAS